MNETTSRFSCFPYIPDDVELEPCPFCGGVATNFWNDNHEQEHDDEPSWSVSCGDCACDGPPGRTHAEAIKAWNKRS
jgi:Lar family restriction alleviation protein